MNRHKTARGFTLIEMLVAMTVLAIFTAFAIKFSADFVDSNDIENVMEKQADQFLTAAVFAEEQAVLTGDPLGLIVLPPDAENTWRYYWQHYRGGEWVDSQQPLIANQVPDGLEVALVIEGENIDFKKIETLGDEKVIPVPVVIFYPGGEVTPFRLTFYNRDQFDQQVFLTSERTGQVEWLPSEEDLYVSFQ